MTDRVVLPERLTGPGGLVLRRWVASDAGELVATRVAHVLTGAGLVVPGITRMEIHHDNANQASAGIPRALGFEWVGESPREPVAPAETVLEWRWRMDKDRTRGFRAPPACDPEAT